MKALVLGIVLVGLGLVAGAFGYLLDLALLVSAGAVSIGLSFIEMK